MVQRRVVVPVVGVHRLGVEGRRPQHRRARSRLHHNSSAAIDIGHLREPGLAPSLGVVEIHEEGEDARPLWRPHRRVLVRVRARVRARVRVWARVRARLRLRHYLP